jgi:lipopolysaccharide cholinephosphotransferase
MKKLMINAVQEVLLDLMKIVHQFMLENQLKYYLLGGSALGAVRHNGFIPWDDDIDIGMERDDYEKFLGICSQFDDRYEVVNFLNRKNCDFGLTRIYINNTYIENPTISNTKLDKRLYLDIFPLDNVPDDDEVLAAYEKKIVSKKKTIQRIDVRDYKDSKSKLLIKRIVSLALQPFRQYILHSFDSLMKRYRYCRTERICSLCSQYSFDKQVMMKTIYGTPTLHKFEDAEFYIPENIHAYLTTLFGVDYTTVPPVEKRRKGYDIYSTSEE